MPIIIQGVDLPIPVIAEIDPKNQSQLVSVYLVTFRVTGHLNPFESSSARVSFLPNPFPQNAGRQPSAAWLGDFSGGDFAELNWTIQSVDVTGFNLFAVNISSIIRSPGSSDGTPLTIKAFVSF